MPIFESRVVTDVHLNREKQPKNLKAERLKCNKTKADNLTLVPLNMDKENWVFLFFLTQNPIRVHSLI